jgi:hypothetical protein
MKRGSKDGRRNKQKARLEEIKRRRDRKGNMKRKVNIKRTNTEKPKERLRKLKEKKAEIKRESKNASPKTHV